MSRFAIQEPDPYPYDVNPDYQAEHERLEAHDALVAILQNHGREHGWPDTCRALAKAMDAEAQLAAECERRR